MLAKLLNPIPKKAVSGFFNISTAANQDILTGGSINLNFCPLTSTGLNML